MHVYIFIHLYFSFYSSICIRKEIQSAKLVLLGVGLRSTTTGLAVIDVAAALAQLALERSYVRPLLSNNPTLKISDGT